MLGIRLHIHWGKTMLAAAVLAVASQAPLFAGEADGQVAPAALTSMRKNAAVHIGGEVRVDYTYRSGKESGLAAHSRRDTELADLTVRNANLRLKADVNPHLHAIFKLDLSSRREVHKDSEDILEEAMLVMSAVGGRGLGFFAGKGRVPYGQDVTLGMLQSYHHIADQSDSSEGRIFIIDPPDVRTGGDGAALSPMRPGQMERAYTAGASYEWDDRAKMELAAFQPHSGRYADRLLHGRDNDRNAGIGAAARLWWQPLEELTVQASAMLVRSSDMGRETLRLDVQSGARGTALAKSLSVGFDYRRDAWRVFGEYQHGWDWNFTKGYSTDTWQIGAARKVCSDWTLTGMVEGLHITDRAEVKVEDDYYKVALNVRRSFDSGLFILAEYGREWRRRHRDNQRWDRGHGNFFGVRFGFSF